MSALTPPPRRVLTPPPRRKATINDDARFISLLLGTGSQDEPVRADDRPDQKRGPGNAERTTLRPDIKERVPMTSLRRAALLLVPLLVLVWIPERPASAPQNATPVTFP